MRLNRTALLSPARPGSSLLSLGLLALGLPLASLAAPGPALSVDLAAATHPISPDIYGMNFADEALARELRLPVRRLGGNATSRYNWKIDVSNRGSDWYFENIPEEIMNGGTSDPNALPDGSSANRFIEQDRRTGTKTLLTLPLSGWVAKRRPANDNHPFDCGFKVSVHGAQQSTDPWDADCGNGLKADGTPLTGNNPTDTSLAIGPEFVGDWVRYLMQRYGRADQGGVRFVNLDNEPELWSHTHRDVRPQPLSYDELRDRTLQYAAAVKQADPSMKTLGPSGWGWNAYFYSDKDTSVPNFWENPPDRNAHGGTPFVEWHLQQLSAYEKSHGVRLLDYLDEHYYPQANQVVSEQTDEATNALRLRQTRVLWDPSYVDESWINQPVQLIPRMRDWVNRLYPGTKLAISEYNFGAQGHLNGALALADVLGIFGREALDLATLWSPPKATDPAAHAFRIYRNFDGAGGAFGDTSLSARSADQGQLAIYAARRSLSGELTLVVVNKTAQELTSPVSLSGSRASGAAKVYRYSSADLTKILREADVTVANGGFSTSYPANSVSVVVVPAEAGGHAACHASLLVSRTWPGGYAANVTLTHTGTQLIKGWTLRWQMPAGQTVDAGWNAVLQQTGQEVSAQNPDWNPQLAPGASVDIGFIARGSETAAPTPVFSLNGVTCR